MLNIQTRQEGKTVVLTLQGNVNSEVITQLRDAIHDAVGNLQPKLLVINLKDVTFIDSSGCGLLVATHHRMEEIAGLFHLYGLSHQVKKTFEETNLMELFSIFATELDALRNK